MNEHPFQLIASTGLGYSYSSLQQIGDFISSKPFGQSHVNIFINAVSGNLIIRDHCYAWAERNFPVELFYLFNQNASSLEQSWRLPIKSMKNPPVSGMLPETVTIIEADGHESTYHKSLKPFPHYVSPNHAAGNPYITVSLESSNWVWYDPVTHVTELYDAEGFLIERRDDKQNITTFHYKDNLLESIHGPSGSQYQIRREDNGGDTRDEKIYLVDSAGAETLIHHYIFDKNHMLMHSDISKNYKVNGEFYRTSYDYHPQSHKLHSIQQADGTLVGFDFAGEKVISLVIGNKTKVTYNFDFQPAHFVMKAVGGMQVDLDFDSSHRVIALTRYRGYGTETSSEVTHFSYNDNRLESTTYPDGSFDEKIYSNDHFGLCVQHTCRNGQITKHTYQKQGIRDYLATTLTYLDDQKRALVTRFVYEFHYVDGKQSFEYLAVSLQYQISSMGQVKALEYDEYGLVNAKRKYITARFQLEGRADDSVPSLDQMQKWQALQNPSDVALTENAYDFRGLNKDHKMYASVSSDGVGIVDEAMSHSKMEFNYFGQMLKRSRRVLISGQQPVYVDTIYQFDALQRQVLFQDAMLNITSTEHIDNLLTGYVSHKTLPNSRIESTYYDDRELVSHTEVTSTSLSEDPFTTQYQYDQAGRRLITQHPDKTKTYQFHDVQDQPIFEVSATGYVVEHQYSAQSRCKTLLKYSQAIDTKNLLNNLTASQVARLISSKKDLLHDRKYLVFYDTMGKEQVTVDPESYFIESRYNLCGLLTDTTHYANKISPQDLSSLMDGHKVDFHYNPLEDRRESRYYNDDLMPIATLNADGWIVELERNAIGFSTGEIRYSTPYREAVRPVNYSDLRPAKSSKDPSTFNFYNGLGMIVCTINARGYIETRSYTPTVKIKQTYSFYNKVDASWYQDTSKLPSLPVKHSEDRVRNLTYDQMDRNILSEALSHPSMIEEFDNMGLKTHHCQFDLHVKDDLKKRANPDNERSLYWRHDQFGRVSHKLNASLSNKIAVIKADEKLTPKEKEERIYAVWGGAAVYTYDNFSKLLADTTNTQHGLIIYFYDHEGREIVRVDSDGCVTEYGYNAFGEVVEIRKHVKRLESPLGQGGGFISEKTSELIVANRDDSDSVTKKSHDRRGDPVEIIDPEEYRSIYTYNAFREIFVEVLPLKSKEPELTITHTYNPLGKEVEHTKKNDGLISRWTKVFNNLYGKLTQQTNEVGVLFTFEHDLLGNLEFKRNSAGVMLLSCTYDAYNRVSTEMDGLEQQSVHTYDQATLVHTISGPEPGVISRTQSNIFNQIICKTDALERSYHWSHNPFGKLVSHNDSLGNKLLEITYDDEGFVYTQSFATGYNVKFLRSSLGVVNQKILNPDLWFAWNTFIYKRDGLNRPYSVTDPSDYVFSHDYDRRSLLTRSVSPSVKNQSGEAYLTEKHAYNGMRSRLSVKHGSQEKDNQYLVNFVHDPLGRHNGKVVDPLKVGSKSPLVLSSTHDLDARGRVRVSVDAKQQNTFLVYDEYDRLCYQIRPNGSVLEKKYNLVGNEVEIRQLHNFVDVSLLSKDTTLEDAERVITSVYSDLDTRLFKFYDASGRNIYSVSVDYDFRKKQSFGYVIEKRWNIASQLMAKVAYANAIDASDIENISRVDLKNKISISAEGDRVTHYFPDENGRNRFIVNPCGYIVEQRHDAAGRIIHEIKYSVGYDDLSRLNNLSLAELIEYTERNSNSKLDQHHYNVFSVSRKPDYTVSPSGHVKQYFHNHREQLTRAVSFTESITVPKDYNTLVSVLKALAYNKEVDRIIEYDYDNAYRLVASGCYYEVDGSYFNPADKFHRDDVGNIYEHVDRDDNSWNMDYDRGNRLLMRTSPSVPVTSVSQSSSGGLVYSEALRPVKEFYGYDSNNNNTLLVRDYEGSDSREMHLEYDEVNHSNKVILPKVEVDDETQEASFLKRPTKMIELHHSTVRNAKGKTVFSQKSNGKCKFYIYSPIGRLLFEVTSDGSITEYERNSFGESVGIINYANKTKLSLSDYQTTGIPLEALLGSLEVSQLDRYQSITRDGRGLPIEHARSLDRVTRKGGFFYFNPEGQYGYSSQLTRREYDAFRNTSSIFELQFAKPDVWHKTYRWHDLCNNLAAKAELVKSSYQSSASYRLTRYRHNGFNELEETYKYAKSLTLNSPETISLHDFDKLTKDIISGKDVCRYKRYNQLGKVQEEGKRNVTREKVVNGVFQQYTVENLATYKSYTGSGLLRFYSSNESSLHQQECVRDARGFQTAHFGQVRSYQASRSEPGGYLSGQPYIKYGINAHGQRVVIHRFATAADNNVPAESDDDQIEVSLMDSRGLVALRQDAKGNVSYKTYTSDSRVKRQWHGLSNWEKDKASKPAFTRSKHLDLKLLNYDVVGRLHLSQWFRDGVKVQATEKFYSLFGEDSGEGVGDGVHSSYSLVNSSGRVWNTNLPKGVPTVKLLDLMGRITGELQATTDTDLKEIHISDLPALLDSRTQPADIELTKRFLDTAGRLLKLEAPPFSLQPDVLSKNIPLEVYLSGDFLSDFGEVSLTWVTPKETSVKGILKLGVVGSAAPFQSHELTVANGRTGLNVSNFVTDLYQYEIKYYLIDPLTGRPDTSTVMYYSSGQVDIITPYCDSSQHLVAHIQDDHVLRLSGNTEGLSAVELWSDEEKIATVDVKYDPTAKDFYVDLIDQQSGSYKVKAVIGETVKGDFTLPFKIHTALLAISPQSRQIPCDAQLQTLGSKGQLSIWNTLPKDFSSLPIHYECEFTNSDDLVKNVSGTINPSDPTTHISDKNGSTLDSNIDFTDPVKCINTLSLWLIVSESERVPLYTRAIPHNTQADKTEFSIRSRGQKLTTLQISYHRKPLFDAESDGWEVVEESAPHDNWHAVENNDGLISGRELFNDDIVLSAKFSPRNIVYIRPIKGLTEIPSVQYFDVRDGRLALWKSIAAAGITSLGLVVDVTGLAPGNYPFKLDAKQDKFLFTINGTGEVFTGQSHPFNGDFQMTSGSEVMSRVHYYERDSRDNVTSHTDAEGHRYEWEYNDINKSVVKRLPPVDVYDEDGSLVSGFIPTFRYGYSEFDHLIASVNPAQTVFAYNKNSVGQQLSRISALDQTIYDYTDWDILGRRISLKPGSYGASVWTFSSDKLNNVIGVTMPLETGEVQTGLSELTINRLFDEVNNLALHQQGTSTYRYNHTVFGKIERSFRCDLSPTIYTFARSNQLVRRTDPDGRSVSSTPHPLYGYFGVMGTFTDLGGAVYTSEFDRKVQLIRRTSHGGDHGYSYEVTVHSKRIDNGGTSSSFDDGYNLKTLLNAPQSLEFIYSGGMNVAVVDHTQRFKTNYVPDRNGRMCSIEIRDFNHSLVRVSQSNLDSLGREIVVLDDSLSGKLGFDRVGNRRFESFHIKDAVSGQFLNVARWNLFDKENRILVDGGELISGTIKPTSKQGRQFIYFNGLRVNEITLDSSGKELWNKINYYYGTQRLKKIEYHDRDEFIVYTENGQTASRHIVDISTGSQKLTSFEYTDSGFMSDERIQKRSNNQHSYKLNYHTSFIPTLMDVIHSLTTTDYTQQQELSYTVTYRYKNFGDRKISSLEAVTHDQHGDKTTISQLFYDSNGNINAKLGVEKLDEDPLTSVFLTSHDGIPLRQLYFDETWRGGFRHLGIGGFPFYTSQNFYMGSYTIKQITDHSEAALRFSQGYNSYSIYGQAQGMTVREMLSGLVAIGSFKASDPITSIHEIAQQSAMSQYTVHSQGESYESIARMVAENPEQAGVIAAMNMDLIGSPLQQGETIMLPRMIPMRYTDKTQIPMAVLLQQFIGKITPELQWAQASEPFSNCLVQTIEIVIMVVVAIVVPELVVNPIVAAILAAVLDAALQGIAVEVGLLSHISWLEVAEAGIGAGIHAEVGSFVKAYPYANQALAKMVGAGATNILDQVAEIGLGYRKNIDIKSVVSSMIGEGIQSSIDSSAFKSDDVLTRSAKNLSDEAVSALTNYAVMGAPINLRSLAIQYLGSEIGEALGESIATKIHHDQKNRNYAEKESQKTNLHRPTPHPMDDYYKAIGQANGMGGNDHFMSDLESYYSGGSDFTDIADITSTMNSQPKPHSDVSQVRPQTLPTVQSSHASVADPVTDYMREYSTLMGYYYAGYGGAVAEAELTLYSRMNQSLYQTMDEGVHPTRMSRQAIQSNSGFNHFLKVQELELDATAGTIKQSLGNFFRHPLTSLLQLDRDFGYAVTHPSKVWQGIQDSYHNFEQGDDFTKAKMMGGLTGQGLLASITGGGVAFKEAAEASALARSVRAAGLFARGGGAEGMSGGRLMELNPHNVRFSQRWVSYGKSRGVTKYTYSDIVDSMKTEGWKDNPIDVIRMPDGKITSIDNTRVLAAREAGIDLKVRVWGHDEALPEGMARRFRDPLNRQVFAETWGEAANFRMMGQPEQFINQYLPYGSIDDPLLSYNLNTDLINFGR